MEGTHKEFSFIKFSSCFLFDLIFILFKFLFFFMFLFIVDHSSLGFFLPIRSPLKTIAEGIFLIYIIIYWIYYTIALKFSKSILFSCICFNSWSIINWIKVGLINTRCTNCRFVRSFNFST